MRHIKFPSIEQFRHVVRQVKASARYKGVDENGNKVYYEVPDDQLEMPKITFNGTVKLHGTNAGVCKDSEGNVWWQGRNRNVTTVSDNHGFAFFCESQREELESLLSQLESENKDLLNDHFGGRYNISIYGEWCGSNIQGKVALTELHKSFVMFAAKATQFDKPQDDLDNSSGIWLNMKHLSSSAEQIKNIYDYPVFNYEIDFSDPDKAAEELTAFTLAVEKECPFAKAHGVSGIGEGIVWSAVNGGLRFKTKGEEHQKSDKSKKKTVVSASPEKLASIDSFVEYAVNNGRLEQSVKEVFGENEPEMSGFGRFLKWINQDIIKEEMDVLVENNLEPKDVNKKVSAAALKWFKGKYA